MDNQKLKVVHQGKALRILITEDLKASQQCQLAYNKASRILGLINRTIEYRHTDILLCLYKSFVRPHLEYSVSACSPHYSKDKVLIEKIQRFTKMIPSLRNLPYETRLQKLGLWTFFKTDVSEPTSLRSTRLYMVYLQSVLVPSSKCQHTTEPEVIP